MSNRRAFLQAILGIPLAAEAALRLGLAPPVPGKTSTIADGSVEWENTKLRVALFKGDTEVSGHGYRRVLAQSKGGTINPLGTTTLRAEFPLADSKWGLVDSYKIYENGTNRLVAKGLISRESRTYINQGDTASMDIDIDILGETEEA